MKKFLFLLFIINLIKNEENIKKEEYNDNNKMWELFLKDVD